MQQQELKRRNGRAYNLNSLLANRLAYIQVRQKRMQEATLRDRRQTMAVNYDDKRFQQVNNEKTTALNEVNSMYNNMITKFC